MSKISNGFISASINGIKIDYSIPCNSANYNNKSSRDIGYFVIHYTGNDKDTAKNNVTYFKNGSRSASAHFFVDDSNIYQSVELRDEAWSVGCTSGYKNSVRNSNSISIEMCTSGGGKVSQKTQINAAYLMAYLINLCGYKSSDVDSRVFRHYDVVKSNKKCPAQYVSDPKQFTQFKTWIKNILNTGNHSGEVKQTNTSTSKSVNYLIKVANVPEGDVLNIRKEPNSNSQITGKLKYDDPNKYTIILEQNGWLKLKSGLGWINGYYAKKV